MSVRFTQSCPTCGRRIQVRASLMGCDVACQHCHAVFVAEQDSAHLSVQPEVVADDLNLDPLMDRVEQALSRAKVAAAAS
jgi:hypothetical protein